MTEWYDSGQVNPHIQTGKSGLKPKEIKDPWKHRSTGMKCNTCMYYVQKGDKEGFGRCRANAPSMKGYPAVFSNDWCGNHKMDEAKLLCG